MTKSILTKIGVYLFALVFIVPIVLLILIGNASRKAVNTGNQAQPTETPLPTSFPTNTVFQNVPLPSKEDIVRTFCGLIDEGRISDAVSMMDVKDETTRQSWGVSLNNFSSFKLVDIKKSAIDETGNSFEVDINVTLKKNLTDLPIPNYGWVNGMNKKWIGVVDGGSGHYKITGIATGP
jgi:hypothetical protein